MKKQFYTHLIETDSILVKLHELGLSEEQKIQLLAIVESSLHHTVLDAILSELSEEDKELFFEHIEEDDHTKTWKFLNEKVDTIEEKIVKAAKDLTKELHDDIEDVKNNGNN
ncbi:MAG: hypothetical protein QG600_469 [Patescibacteria group bacterium]|jgi:hypothetical protein|nr:hypothetical protein [Patescibacteria group bacterium]